MKILKSILLAGIILFGSINIANATILSFENISKLNNYSGLKWTDFGVTNGYSQGGGYKNGIESGTNVAYNTFGMPAFVTSSKTFTFNGAYINSAWLEDLHISVVGLNLPSNFIQKVIKGTISLSSLNPIYYKEITVNTLNNGYFEFNFKDINTLAFISSGGVNENYGPINSLKSLDTQWRSTQFVIDDFKINEAPLPPAAPEPSTIILGFLGLSGLISARRKKVV